MRKEGQLGLPGATWLQRWDRREAVPSSTGQAETVGGRPGRIPSNAVDPSLFPSFWQLVPGNGQNHLFRTPVFRESRYLGATQRCRHQRRFHLQRKHSWPQRCEHPSPHSPRTEGRPAVVNRIQLRPCGLEARPGHGLPGPSCHSGAHRVVRPRIPPAPILTSNECFVNQTLAVFRQRPRQPGAGHPEQLSPRAAGEGLRSHVLRSAACCCTYELKAVHV